MVSLGPTYAMCLQMGSESAKDVASEYGISTLTSPSVREQSFGELSWLNVRLPWRLLATHAGRDQYLDLVRFICEALSVKHGYVGLSLGLPFDFDRMLSFEYQLAQQFSGLMIDTYGFGGIGEFKNE